MLKFKQYIDMTKYNDSNELDSGEKICDLNLDDKKVTIKVVGKVRITYKDKTYYRASEMPKELLQIIHDGDLWDNRDIYVDMNNWFEMFYGEDDTHDPQSDVVSIEGYTPDQLLSLCLEVINNSD